MTGVTPRVEVAQVLADHVERQVVVALQLQREAQPVDVGGRELAITGLRARGRHDSLHLEEAQLGCRQGRKLRRETSEHLPDAEQARAGRGVS